MTRLGTKRRSGEVPRGQSRTDLQERISEGTGKSGQDESRQQSSDETRRHILAAAGELFASKGFDAVTMREIARAVNRSHTTIYLHFADKEALLHELSAPALQELKERLERTLRRAELSAEEQLREMGRQVIRFFLENRSMYELFFEVGSGRVDEQEPKLELNRLRNELFNLLLRALGHSMPRGISEERLLTQSRIYYYLLRGIIGTYAHSRESADELMERLTPTFDEAATVLLLGFRAQLSIARDDS